jgi:MerR family copper efflux transcriptional regulator
VTGVTDLLISQLADRCGIPATTLRFYEGAGLLPAGRTPSGYRVYGDDAVDRLGFITAAKRLGLPLAEIAEVLRVWADGSCAEVRDNLRPRLAARITEAEQRASELAALTAALHNAVEHLDALPDRDSRCGPQCGFLAPSPAKAAQAVTLHRTREHAGHTDAGQAHDQMWRSAPVACSLDGPAMTGRIRQWHELISDADREPIPHGIRLTMPAGLAAQVAALAAAEQECCPFFDFRIHLAGGWLHLEVRAPAEAQAMLAELLAVPC